MAPTPRRSIDPAYLAGMSCPICGRDALELKVMDRFPDYISCGNCQSQFVTEEAGERVMYGKIPASYPRTSRFALQQWVWPEAVARRSLEERPAERAAPVPPAPVEPDVPLEPEPAPTPEPSGMPAPIEPEAEYASEVEQPDDRLIEKEAEAIADDSWTPEFDEPAGAQAVLGSEDADLWPDELEEESLPAATEQALGDPLEAFGDLADDQQMAAFDTMIGADEPDGPADEPADAELPDWAAEAEPAAETGWPPEPIEDEPAGWLAAEDRADEAADELPLPEPEDSERTQYTPPFGADSAPDEADLPGDFEPAPAMPAWLRAEAAAASEPDDSPAPPAEADGEDLLAALWGDEPPADEDPETPDDLAARLGFSQETEEPIPMESQEPDWTDDSFLEDLDFEDSERAGLEQEPALEADAEEQPSEAALQAAAAYWAGAAAEKASEPEPPLTPAPVAEQGEEGPVERPADEPVPGLRYRVVLTDSRPVFPNDMCAHCTRAPANARLAHTATVYRGAGLGERQIVTFRVPLCADCHARHSAQSEEAANARLQAHLVSLLVALILVIGAIAIRLVDFQGSLALNLAILFVLALMGYSIPAVLLLIRAGRYSQPADSAYVGSTLRVPADTEGLDTAFEWRNQTYAGRFHQVNQERATGNVTKVRERSYEGPLT